MASDLSRLVRRLYVDGFVRGDLDALDAVLAVDVVGHDTLPPGVGNGRVGYRRTVQLFRSAFEPIGYEIHEVLAAGVMVAARVTMTGVHSGTFLGMPPSGRTVCYPGMDFFRCENGLIAEHWALSDDLGLLQQIGVLPADAPWSRES